MALVGILGVIVGWFVRERQCKALVRIANDAREFWYKRYRDADESRARLLHYIMTNEISDADILSDEPRPPN